MLAGYLYTFIFNVLHIYLLIAVWLRYFALGFTSVRAVWPLSFLASLTVCAISLAFAAGIYCLALHINLLLAGIATLSFPGVLVTPERCGRMLSLQLSGLCDFFVRIRLIAEIHYHDLLFLYLLLQSLFLFLWAFVGCRHCLSAPRATLAIFAASMAIQVFSPV